jgi:hypothetical protein
MAYEEGLPDADGLLRAGPAVPKAPSRSSMADRTSVRLRLSTSWPSGWAWSPCGRQTVAGPAGAHGRRQRHGYADRCRPVLIACWRYR